MRGRGTVSVLSRCLPAIQIVLRRFAAEAHKQQVQSSISRQGQPDGADDVALSIRALNLQPAAANTGVAKVEHLTTGPVEGAVIAALSNADGVFGASIAIAHPDQ